MSKPQRLFEAALGVLPDRQRYASERYLRGWFDRRRLQRADYAVVSFGKSGRTWVRVMVSRLYQTRYGMAEDSLLEFDNYFRANHDIPRVFFTHDNYLRDFTGDGGSKRAYADKRVLLLVRHPADVAMSQYFQWRHRMRPHKIRLNDYPRDRDLTEWDFLMGPSGIDKVISFMNEWADGLAEVRDGLTVRYEDLRAHTVEELRRIAGFLKLPADDDDLADAVDYASVANMREREAKAASDSARLRAADPSNPDSFKTRRAKVGGFRDYFDDGQIEAIEARVDEALDPAFGYRRS